jgi:large subunit ribosomal protein L49
MGRTKGWRIARKVAEDFVGFNPPPVSTKLRTHARVINIANQLSQPLEPLKYKLKHDAPSMLEPMGGTEDLPFNITRTHVGNLPVYTDFRNNRSRELTVVRKITGDVDEFKTELAKVVSNAPIYEKMGRIEIKGLH